MPGVSPHAGGGKPSCRGVSLHAGGIPECSRWSSETTPPESNARMPAPRRAARKRMQRGWHPFVKARLRTSQLWRHWDTGVGQCVHRLDEASPDRFPVGSSIKALPLLASFPIGSPRKRVDAATHPLSSNIKTVGGMCVDYKGLKRAFHRTVCGYWPNHPHHGAAAKTATTEGDRIHRSRTCPRSMIFIVASLQS